MEANEYLNSIGVNYEDGWHIQELTPSKLYRWMEGYAKLKQGINKDGSVVSDDFIKGWDARERQLRDNGWLKDDYDVYGSGYSSDELIKYSKK